MALHDAAWHDAQYNNRARVPDAATLLLPRWAQASALARSRMTCLLDQPYGDEPGETLDVFPARNDGAPVLVFIHGGWWRALDKSDHSFVAPAFVQAGAMVVVPNYALCPAVTIEPVGERSARFAFAMPEGLTARGVVMPMRGGAVDLDLAAVL